MILAPPSTADPEFQHALEEFASMQWRSGVRAEKIGSPQRITPFSIVITLDFVEDDEELGTRRSILLHDPAGSEDWEGCFRLVSYMRAEVDQETVTNPLPPETAWSWPTDALSRHGAAHRALAGTVTASYDRGFGELTTHQAEVEVRTSWTPAPDNHHRMTVQLKAWQDLLGHVPGRLSLPRGVVQLPGRSRTSPSSGHENPCVLWWTPSKRSMPAWTPFPTGPDQSHSIRNAPTATGTDPRRISPRSGVKEPAPG